jgi:superfamily I DNA and RNA helicase
VEAFFRQTFDLVPAVHAYVRGQERSFARLAGGLLTLVDGLQMSPFRLRILGTAGCGKTMIARHVFDHALDQGRRPLLLCFNRPLSERLKIAVRPGGRVTTWYGLCAAFLEDRGHRIDFERMREPGFWERITEMIIGETVPDSWRFDTLIVDEGQDFEQFWADALWLFLRPDAEVTWLEDPDQNLRRVPSVQLDGFVTYRARVNCRSPRSIAHFVRRVLPRFEFQSGSDLPGLGVGVTTYRESPEQPAIVARIVASLLRQGFRNDEIVLLTTRHVTTPGTERSVFSDLDRAGNYRLRRFTGDYDLLGHQILTQGQLTFDSITRYKGQEAPAVILVDVDPDPADLDQGERLLLSGMTRATVRLELLVRAANPLGATFLTI